MEPEKYLFDGAEFGFPDACVFGVFSHIGQDQDDRYILGVPFMENYYTIFD